MTQPTKPGLRERKKEKTRRQILDCARALFAENGFPATSMESIAEQAEVSATTLYNYYGTKSQVLLALIERSDAKVISKEKRPAITSREDCILYIANFISRLSEQSLKNMDVRSWRYAVAYSIIHNDKEESSEDSLPMNVTLRTYITGFLAPLEGTDILGRNEDVTVLTELTLDIFRALFIRLISTDPPAPEAYRNLVHLHIRSCFDVAASPGTRASLLVAGA